MKPLHLIKIAILLGWCGVLVGCANIKSNDSNIIEIPRADSIIQGKWVASWETALDQDTAVVMQFDEGSFTLEYEDNEINEIATAEYYVEGIAGTKHTLHLSNFNVAILSSTAGYTGDELQKEEQKAVEGYTEGLETVVVDVSSTNRMEFYPQDQTTDSIFLYRQ